MSEATDEHFMKRALELARQNLGVTSPNPSVGAVVVKDGKVLGEGLTEPPGGKHAEQRALESCDPKDATLYVTLEPCCHENKRTGPCCNAIANAGISRVVIGTKDCNPEVNGRGIAALRNAGIEVSVGVLEREARECHEFFFRWVTAKRPFVTLKLAMTTDGRLTWGDGKRKKISGEAAQQNVHELRRKHDAVMVGIGTVLKDDPQLTCRTGGRNPIRVVLDSKLRIPQDARVFSERGNTIVFSTKQGKVANADVIAVREKNGRLDLDEVLDVLGELGITSLLVEAGPTLAAALVNEKRVDKFAFFVAPFSKAEGESFFSLIKGAELQDVTERRVGDDLLVEGHF